MPYLFCAEGGEQSEQRSEQGLSVVTFTADPAYKWVLFTEYK